MKTKRFYRHTIFTLMIAFSTLVVSCDFFADSEYDINIMVTCNGGTTDDFTVSYLIDDKIPLTFSFAGTNLMTVFPAGNIKKAMITATKNDTTSALTILVFKDGEVDKNGVATLASCVAGTTTSCSNTVVLNYEVNKKDEDKTKGTAAAGKTEKKE